MLQVLIDYRFLFFEGFLVTLQLIGYIAVIGIPGGVLLGLFAGRYFQPLAQVIKFARFLTKVVPVLVVFFWLHYPFQSFFSVVINPFWTTVFALGVINIVTIAGITIREIELLPVSYAEAGKTLGLSRIQIIRHIEAPLLFRRVLPDFLITQAAMLEYTLFASLISVPELFRTAQTINSMIYKPVEIYSLLVIFFTIILTPLHLTVSWVEKKYNVTYD